MIFFLFLMACESVVLRKEKPLPFKINKGIYSFDIFKLSYPEEIREKESFFDTFSEQLSAILIQNKRIILLLNEKFIQDSMALGKTGLFAEETFFFLPASELSEADKKKLLAYFNMEGNLKSQELLNLQVKYVFEILGKEFVDKDYTELFKERAIEDLAKHRKRVLALLKFKNVELFCEASAYGQKEKRSIKNYFTKGITLRKDTFNKNLDKYSKFAKVLISDMKDEDLEKILSEEDKIALKELFILNKYFNGFKNTNSSAIFLINGEEEVYSSGYKFKFNFYETELEELSTKASLNLFSDLNKTNKELTEELAKHEKLVKRLTKDKTLNREKEVKKDDGKNKSS